MTLKDAVNFTLKPKQAARQEGSRVVLLHVLTTV